jgi:hypothetical protein
VGRAIRPEIVGGEVTGMATRKAPAQRSFALPAPGLPVDNYNVSPHKSAVRGRSLSDADCCRLAGSGKLLRDLYRMWNCTCHEPEAVNRTLGFARQGNDK